MFRIRYDYERHGMNAREEPFFGEFGYRKPTVSDATVP